MRWNWSRPTAPWSGTEFANRLAEEAIVAGLVPPLAGFQTLKREQRYGRNSRIDILLEDEGKGSVHVEVKNVHFIRAPGQTSTAASPAQAAKHLDEMGNLVETGRRAAMLFVIQRADCERLKICSDLDPAYGRAFARAIARGVEAYAIRCALDRFKIVPECLIPIDEDGLRAL